jgi:AcrR family transcriptional regulator
MAAERDRPRRNPPTGGYPRGVETRGRIVTAALKVFGEEGYERASTRTIAREAGVRPPALQYYFDSKDGLHLACGQRILDDALGVLSPAILDAERRATRGLALDAVEALCDLLDAFVDASLITAQSPAAGRFLARAQSDEWSPARDLVHENLTRPVHHLCARLVALGTGCAVDDDVRLRTSVILGQVSVLRESTLKIIGWRDFAGVRLDAVKTVLRAHTRASLSVSP